MGDPAACGEAGPPTAPATVAPPLPPTPPASPPPYSERSAAVLSFACALIASMSCGGGLTAALPSSAARLQLPHAGLPGGGAPQPFFDIHLKKHGASLHALVEQ